MTADRITPRETTSQMLLRLMSAGRTDVITKTIPFLNDDVPKYLENLRRFREESAKVSILIT